MMVQYEIKKVFCRIGGKIALLLLAATLGITCFLSLGVNYTNTEGETETGIITVRKLRAQVKPWTGVLDEQKIGQVIAENLRIKATPEAQSEDITQNNIAYSWMQGIREIRNLLNISYSDDFQKYDYYTADSLSVDDAVNFYINRPKLLKKWLESDQVKEHFSDAEKQFLIRQYETLDTPFYYDYFVGWRHLLEHLTMLIMFTIFILGYLIAGIFSNEFQWKADAIFFTTVYGRNKAVSAKIKAGFFITTVIYWAMILLFTAIILLCLGADGASCPVQADWTSWKCFYHITIWQEYLLAAVGGYIGCLFITFLTMFVSAKTNSSILAVTVPFITTFIPGFLDFIEKAYIEKILGLLPDRLLQIPLVIDLFDIYEIGGKVLGAIPIIFVLYGILTVIFPAIIYREYRHKEGA